MKIALVGWSGNKNWGDERMYYCIRKYFHKHTIVRFTSFLDAILNVNKINSCDYVLIGGGGLIFRGFNRYSDFLRSITKPLGCIGISIESDGLNKDMVEGLEILKDKADFIYVRDAKSRTMLNNHHKVILGPDIAFLYPYLPTKEVNEDVCAVNFRNWFWWDIELHSEWHERLARWDTKYPWIRWFYPFRTWNPTACMGLIKQRFRRMIPLPLYFGKFDKSDVAILKGYFRSVPNKTSLTSLSSSRYLVGMRLHSLIFATQLGIPFVSLSYEPKNINYCAELGLPELSLPLLEYRDLPNKILDMKNNYGMIREQLLSYTEQSQKKVNRIFDSIEVLMTKRVREFNELIL